MAEKLKLDDWSFNKNFSIEDPMEINPDFITTDPKLQSFHSSLSNIEEKQLEENLINQGCINPLIVWERKMQGFIIVDGHYRFRICQRHNIKFLVRKINVESIEEAKAYMLEEQLGRRNLTTEQLQYYRGLKYEGLVKTKGPGKITSISGNNDIRRACELLAEKYHVSRSTIIRDAEFAKGMNILGKANNKIKNQVLSGTAKLAKKDVQVLAKMPSGQKLGKVDSLDDLILKIHSLRSFQERAKNEHAIKRKLERQDEFEKISLSFNELFKNDEERLKSLKTNVVSCMREGILERKAHPFRVAMNYLKEMELIVKKGNNKK